MRRSRKLAGSAPLLFTVFTIVSNEIAGSVGQSFDALTKNSNHHARSAALYFSAPMNAKRLTVSNAKAKTYAFIIASKAAARFAKAAGSVCMNVISADAQTVWVQIYANTVKKRDIASLVAEIKSALTEIVLRQHKNQTPCARLAAHRLA
jgi:hypothetical protein